jgi:hypothetical protein
MKYLILLVMACLLSANSLALDKHHRPGRTITEVCVGGYVYVVYSGPHKGGIVQKFVPGKYPEYPLKPVKCK